MRNLPDLHQRKRFISGADVEHFFYHIQNNPNLPLSIKHSEYSLTLEYFPDRSGPFISSGGGLVQEAPKTIKEHAVYRIIKQKSRQHNVSGKRFVCIGSDQSPALSSLIGVGSPSVRDAVCAALKESRSLSGVMIIKISDRYQPLDGFEKVAKAEIYLNPWAKIPLNESVVTELSRLNFNRWKYFFSLGKYENSSNSGFERSSGGFSLKIGGIGVEIEVPSNILIDSLAGNTNLFESYSLEKGDPMGKYLAEGWTVVGCSFKDGNIEQGLASVVVLQLEPPPEKVFWPSENNT